MRIDGRARWLVLGASALTLWVLVGFFSGLRQGNGGFVYSPSYVVEGILPGGAADLAGLRDGDRVVSVEGIPVEDLPLYSRWPRSLHRRPGEALSLVVERDGVSVPVEVRYGAAPNSSVSLRLGGVMMGLLFLWLGVWAAVTVRTRPATMLASIGFAAGLALPGPSLGTWDGVVSHVQFASMLLLTILLFRLFLIYPRPTRLGRSRTVKRVAYGIWVLFLPLLVLELILHPRLYHAFGGPGALVMFGFLLLAIAAVAHTAFRTPRADLRSSGMSVVLLGLVVALVPALVGFVDWGFVPAFDVPGSGYLFYSLLVIPVALALGVAKQARSGSLSSQERAWNGVGR